MGATPTGATPTGPTLDSLNILVNKFNIAIHVALILFLFSSRINYLLYDTKSVSRGFLTTSIKNKEVCHDF